MIVSAFNGMPQIAGGVTKVLELKKRIAAGGDNSCLLRKQKHLEISLATSEEKTKQYKEGGRDLEIAEKP